MRQGAARGRPHGRLLYGYRRDYEIGDSRKPALARQYPDPETAPVVRRIFTEYLSGVGMPTIAAGLTADGVRTPAGDEHWYHWQVARILRNPAYAGRRQRHGELSDATWEGWEPIVPADVFDKVQARLDRQVERKVRQRPTAHLLTGVGRCGVCGSKMRVVTKDGQASYDCADRHCVARSLLKLDLYVTGRVLERLSQPDVAESLGETTSPAAEAARQHADELRGELAEAFELWQARKLSVGAYARMEADLQPRIAEAEREARRALVPIELDDLPSQADAVDAWWDGLDAERRREVVAALIVAVSVRPLEPGMWPRRFYPELVEIDWR
jgi:hypothetical protein